MKAELNKAMETYSPKKILLLGAGPANLQVVLDSGKFLKLGAELVLLDANAFWFLPNMAPEVISGNYGLKDFSLDLRIICKQHGVEFIQDEVVSLLPESKKVMTRSGRMLRYDLMAVAMGSISAAEEGEVPAEGRFAVRPAKNVLQIRNEIETALELFPEDPLEVAVLGAGPTGIEYVLNLADLLHARRPKAGWRLTLVESAPRILPGFPARAAAIVEKILLAADVKIQIRTKIQHIQSNRLVLEYGRTMPFSLAVVALGRRVPGLFVHAGLDTDDYGAVRVEPGLNHKNYPEIFATGECAQVREAAGQTTARAATLQGRLLVSNLLASIQNQPLKKHPRTRPSRFVSLGQDSAMWIRESSIWHGKWVMLLKHWQERRLMRRIKTYHLS